MKKALLAGLFIIIAASCSDSSGPGGQSVVLTIVPEFDRFGILASNADLLRIRLQTRDTTDQLVTVIDDTVAIDPVSGTAEAQFTVLILQNPQPFIVLLQAIRSSDGAVLFQGEQEVSVAASGGAGDAQEITIPVIYEGPRAAFLEVFPTDTAVAVGATWIYQVFVLDSNSTEIDVPVFFELATPGDSVALSLGRLTGTAEVLSEAVSEVIVTVSTFDSVTTTATVRIGALPAAVSVTPGLAATEEGGTVQLDGVILDQSGNPLGTEGMTWTSRTPAVATVDATGLVTGAASGDVTIVAEAAGFSDSALVSVAPAGGVVVTAAAQNDGFATATVGDTVVLDVVADLRFTAGELLGSYNATLTWETAVLGFIDVQAVDFAAPTVNDANVGAGELRFSAADANGVGQQVVVARIRFLANGGGEGLLQLGISEMSAAQTFTNLISSVIVTNGFVTVSP